MGNNIQKTERKISMQTCKKYQKSPVAHVSHQMHPASSCHNCVYFSKYNCGNHPDANPSNAMMSLNTFAFDA